MTLAQALRDEGLDERATAAGLATGLRNLDQKQLETGKEKLRLDYLKEVVRELAPAERAAGAPDAFVPVILVHSVPRPVRAAPQQQGPPGRRIVEPGGSDASSAHSWHNVASAPPE